MQKLAYKRVLLKISGESLGGTGGHGYDQECVSAIVERVSDALRAGAQIALVVGAGNLWRGAVGAGRGMDRVDADHMGMLATAMNALRLRDAFRSAGLKAEVHSAVPLGPFAKLFDRDAAIQQLSAGELVIFACGTGSPFFTTDTTAALRALETGCQALIKATKVNGIYSADPMKDRNAIRFEQLSYQEALAKRLGVMDAAAFSLCADNKLPTIVLNFSEPGALLKALRGDFSVGTLVS
jgi:uridylate kinase